VTWKHVEARSDADFVVAPDERLSWARTIGIGAQHVVAMFGATFLVPVLTGFPPATTLLFSGVGTVLFLFITGNRLPSYLGSSFSVIAPVTAAVASHGAGSALGGLVAVGIVLMVIGGVVHVVGTHWIDVTLPPVVTGAIVALIGFNLAPAAKSNFEKGPLVGLVTLVLLVGTLAFFRGIIGRLAIFLAVVAGYVLALILGDVDTSAINAASWIGLPEFQTPSFTLAVLPMFLPAVIALLAENIGHVKSVGQMTDTDVDPVIGRAIAADGVATWPGSAAGRRPPPTPKTSASWPRPACIRPPPIGSPPQWPSRCHYARRSARRSRRSRPVCSAARRSCCTAWSGCWACASG
jgi:xanthine/uracil permease